MKRKAVTTEYPPEYLNEVFDYDPQTGIFIWKNRPKTEFQTTSKYEIWRNKNQNTQAGYLDFSSGHWVVNLNATKHRLDMFAYNMIYGVYPDRLGHKDRQRANNAIENLTQENCKPPFNYVMKDVLYLDDRDCNFFPTSHFVLRTISYIFGFYRDHARAESDGIEMSKLLQTRFTDLTENTDEVDNTK